MNTGAISSRYAKALLKFTQETGGGERVCHQAEAILANPDVLATTALEPELQNFVQLLARNGRLGDVRLILRTFVDTYYNSIGVMKGHLRTVVAAPGLEDRIIPLLEKQFGCKVLLDTEIDPAILGGFIIEIGEYQLDASVRHQIELIRRDFVISTNRLV